MRRWRPSCLRAGVGWALLALPGALSAQQAAPAPAQAPDFVREFEALRAEFDAAQEEFFRSFTEGMPEEQVMTLFNDRGKNPRYVYLPRFEDLARRAAGTDAAAESWLMVLELDDGADAAQKQKTVDLLLRDHLPSPALSRLAEHFRYDWWGYGLEPAERALRALAGGSPLAEVQAASNFTLGAILMEQPGRAAEARSLLAKVAEKWPATSYGQQTESYLYELDHLQVGMVAPDFEITDQDGVAFKLSDYRGKVVVLDFWGFW